MTLIDCHISVVANCHAYVYYRVLRSGAISHRCSVGSAPHFWPWRRATPIQGPREKEHGRGKVSHNCTRLLHTSYHSTLYLPFSIPFFLILLSFVSITSYYYCSFLSHSHSAIYVAIILFHLSYRHSLPSHFFLTYLTIIPISNDHNLLSRCPLAGSLSLTTHDHLILLSLTITSYYYRLLSFFSIASYVRNLLSHFPLWIWCCPLNIMYIFQ